MPNSKPIGVAYSDPALVDATISASAISGGSISGSTINSSAIGGTTPAAGAFTTLTSTSPVVVSAASGNLINNANAGIFILSTAITSGVTTTSAPSGSLGLTTNATGLGKLFYSNGTNWLFAAIT
jgi:hypothetical protein